MNLPPIRTFPRVREDGQDGFRLRPLEALSLGAGIQSTTTALMAAEGEITPMPDVAVFADTGGESAATYRHLEWLTSLDLPFPIEVVRVSNLEEDILASARGETGVFGRTGQYMAPPFRTLNADGSTGMLRRECTKNYKIAPIQERIRFHLGIVGRRVRKSGYLVRTWIGFSADEHLRVGAKKKGKDPKWVAKYYPLIDAHYGDGITGSRGTRWMSKQDCLGWLRRHGYPEPPRSACVFCPYLKNSSWAHQRDHDPDSRRRALRVDAAIRDMAERGLNGLKKGGRLYLHHSHRPLMLAKFDRQHGRKARPGPVFPEFTDECEGYCGN